MLDTAIYKFNLLISKMEAHSSPGNFAESGDIRGWIHELDDIENLIGKSRDIFRDQTDD